ncbi:hypothetical protein JM93_02677 [Roseibium hamelinense]|uniref:Uncharacterized protein n=1 Tax=Roseibium hamelinense TaxID=150831 RepID=A0A562SZ99_9HYPH|nr:hypothetical protein [Roseibium hamelinense]TWI85970.1 hypothetical protein JM93_02677 [Roseibium hamelinense]
MPEAALLEIVLVFGGFIAFIIWQQKSLKRDIKAREERERKERENPPPDS